MKRTLIFTYGKNFLYINKQNFRFLCRNHITEHFFIRNGRISFGENFTLTYVVEYITATPIIVDDNIYTPRQNKSHITDSITAVINNFRFFKTFLILLFSFISCLGILLKTKKVVRRKKNMTITFPKIVKLHLFFFFLLRIVITYIFLIILKSIVLACLLAATTLIFTLSPIVYLIFDFSPVRVILSSS